MTKRAVFLHATGGNTENQWWPQVRAEFENSGYEILAPILPGNDRPDAERYRAFLAGLNWDYTENVLVGHSSGATTILNLLALNDFPRIRAAVLVGLFLNENLTSKSADFEQNGQFDGLFPKQGFDWEYLRSKSEKFYLVHGDDDPFCSYDDAMEAAEALDGEMITVTGGGHLSAQFGVNELPQLIDVLHRDHLLV